MKEHAGPGCIIVLVGTKCDVASNKRRVQFEAGKRLSEFYGIDFFEVSAIQNINVTELMQGIARKMIVTHESNSDNKGRRKLREIDGNNVPTEVEGAFTLGCCGTRKGKADKDGGCC